MESFKQYFNELFENPNEIDWIVKTNSLWQGEFFIKDKKYVIKAMKCLGMPWEVKFQLMLNNRPTEEKTGTGDSFLVFSTVISGIKQWLREVDPKIFMLSSYEDNRTSLYSRMLPNYLLAKSIYKIELFNGSFLIKKKTK